MITCSHDGAPAEVLADGLAQYLAAIAGRLESGRARYEGEFESVMTPEQLDAARRMRASWDAEAEADPGPRPEFTYCIRFRPGDPPPELEATLPPPPPVADPDREAVEYAWLMSGRGTPALVMELVATTVRVDEIRPMKAGPCGEARSLPRLARLEGEAAFASPWRAWAERREELMQVRRVVPTSLTFRYEDLPVPLREDLADRGEPPPEPTPPVRYRLRTEGPERSMGLERHPRPAYLDGFPDDDPEGWSSLELLRMDQDRSWFEWFILNSARWDESGPGEGPPGASDRPDPGHRG